MLLNGKNAIIYGAGGSVGGAVARAFGREGARVLLAGRTRETLAKVAADIEKADVGNVAAFAASDWARTITGSEINMTCGASLD